MFNKSTKLFSIFGIDIKVHISWWFVFILLAWGLATGFFPFYFEGFTPFGYWLLGIVAAIMLFCSVLLHELSHSLVAKASNIKVESITLFFFGGVAGISQEDLKPRSELLMSIAGPIFSLFLSVLFYSWFTFTSNIFWIAVTFYLFQLNFVLALFNLVPAYPLDGGRVFRAILYWHYGDLKKATKIASSGGQIFGILLMIIGVLGFFTGQPGIWFILMGGFLYIIAKASYEQVVIKEILSKIALKQFIRKKFTVLKPEMKIFKFFKKYAVEEDAFVVKSKKYSGIFSLENSRIQTGRPLFNKGILTNDHLSLQQLCIPFSTIKALAISDNTYQAFLLFNEQGLELLPVLENGHLVGVVYKKSILKYLLWRIKFA
ncbi:site-2 protease family protein [Candidatus Woesearchaeota archaeon]|nr:site-2 protease family protein [Candidatus Woesearchaeota archaeon]